MRHNKIKQVTLQSSAKFKILSWSFTTSGDTYNWPCFMTGHTTAPVINNSAGSCPGIPFQKVTHTWRARLWGQCWSWSTAPTCSFLLGCLTRRWCQESVRTVSGICHMDRMSDKKRDLGGSWCSSLSGDISRNSSDWITTLLDLKPPNIVFINMHDININN